MLRDDQVITLGQIHRTDPWVWLHCSNIECAHSRPVAVAPFVIRWGPKASGNVLRRNARCERCGHKGAMIATAGSVQSIDSPPIHAPFPVADHSTSRRSA